MIIPLPLMSKKAPQSIEETNIREQDYDESILRVGKPMSLGSSNHNDEPSPRNPWRKS